MNKSSYQIIALGVLDQRFDALKEGLKARAEELGLPLAELAFLTDSDFPIYDRNKPAAAVYFGNTTVPTSPFLDKLLTDSVIIVPVVSSKLVVNKEIPPSLTHINVLELEANGDNIPRLVSLIFEAFRLLRKERGIFISYRRKGSQPLANRLYEELDKRGFDVFIDIRSVPPAVDFQAELWHRMSDVDVIVLIDTPGFREGRWTKAELAQANLLGIQTLHLLWPGQVEDSAFAFSRFMKLEDDDFNGPSAGRGATIKDSVLKAICDRAEELRAQAIALRYAHLVDNFCDAARDIRLNPAVQPERWISVELPSSSLAVVPAVGRPTSDRINAIFDSIATGRNANDLIWVIYDDRGLHERWIKHLRWLDSHLPIRNLSMPEVPAALQELTR
ncbi:toll/interleukin-1 receptor domain-containing protein [Alcaligenes aquatilis]|uniref:toll/interleukin-1 receptor domain-containing protein n=1 Tax=Alcaligenes aquatilis TaxID=323284 RepID=UPI003D1AE937